MILTGGGLGCDRLSSFRRGSGPGRLLLQSSRLSPFKQIKMEQLRTIVASLPDYQMGHKGQTRVLQRGKFGSACMCLYGRWPQSRDYCTKSTVYCLARFFKAQNHIFMARHVGHPFNTFVKGGWIINTCPHPQISGSKGPSKFVRIFLHILKIT